MIVNGYEADPADVEAILADLVDDETRTDPTLLYVRASKMQALYATVAERLGQKRAESVTALADSGASYEQIATHLGLSKGRVQQLIGSARRKR